MSDLSTEGAKTTTGSRMDDRWDPTLDVGFSPKIDSEEFRAAAKKANKTHVLTLAGVAILLAPIVTAIAALIRPSTASIFIGAGIVVEVFVLIIVISLLLKRFAGKSWDGEVVRKRIARESSGSQRGTRRVYITEFRTDDGRKKKYKERTLHHVYNYLAEGDRVRYHPELNYPFEKYDKTHDDTVMCPFCGSLQAIELDTCPTCNKPLLN